MSLEQHYPPGTQENYNNFPSRNLMMEKGKESEFPEGRGGGKGLEILRISEEPGVPPSLEEELDLSWLEDINNTEAPTKYFKTDMEDINIFFIYVNKSSAIFKIEKEKHVLEKVDKKRVLKKEVLIKAIQKRRNPEPKIRYKLRELLLYSVNINPNEIPDYVKNTDDSLEKNIEPVEIIEDIIFSECLPIFHKVNNCFVILEEMVLVMNEKKDPVSILKKEHTTPNTIKKTKKVRISPDAPIKESKSKTEKARDK
jgi:hypothetical protein